MLEGRGPCDDGFHSGLEAYDARIEFFGNETQFDADEGALKKILNMHGTYTGQFAEARAWAASFFSSIFPDTLPAYVSPIKEAETLCRNIHDLMWKVWGALGSGLGDMSVWPKLEEEAVRSETMSIIEDAKKQDIKLIKMLKGILSDLR